MVFETKTIFFKDDDNFLSNSSNHFIENWNNTKNTVMKKALIAKFKTHKELRKKLIDTSNSLIIKNNPNDSYWGCGQDGKGKNILGLLLMEVREIFRNTCVLESEKSYKYISVTDILERFEIGNFLKSLPKNFLLKLRYFEPIGDFGLTMPAVSVETVPL